MRKQYKYSDLNKETNTSGKVTLELMKKRKIKIKPREPKQPVWAIAMEQRINKRFDENDKRWERQEEFNKQQQEFNKYVLDLFKKNNLN